METPPAYAPPKKSNTGLIIGLVLGGIAICCVGGVALLGFFGFRFFKDTLAPMAECVMNYSVVEKAMDEYQKEHDGKLPAAAAWQTELTPYVTKALGNMKKDAGPFKLMDPNGEWGCTGETKTGMAFNTEAAGKKMEEVRSKDIVTVFEVKQTGRNMAMKYEELPRSESPKMMGKPRGWIKIVGGKTHMDGQNESFDFN